MARGLRSGLSSLRPSPWCQWSGHSGMQWEKAEGGRTRVASKGLLPREEFTLGLSGSRPTNCPLPFLPHLTPSADKL